MRHDCYSGGSFAFDINIADGQTHQVAIYSLDWDGSNSRAQNIQITDAVSGAVLDSRSLNAFSGGTYYVYNISGYVRITVTNTYSNAVVSGVFFGN